jgi:hypothetical protein
LEQAHLPGLDQPLKLFANDLKREGHHAGA